MCISKRRVHYDLLHTNLRLSADPCYTTDSLSHRIKVWLGINRTIVEYYKFSGIISIRHSLQAEKAQINHLSPLTRGKKHSSR